MFSQLKSLIALMIVMLLAFALVAPITSVSVVEAQDPVTITWFVGLGAGGQPEQLAAQDAFVEAFNEANDDIELEIIIADNTVARDTLSTLIASGDAPDIVGPVGIKGSNAFAGDWLDLDPIIESTGFDTSIWPQELVDFYRVEGEGLIGLPFGTFPSFIYYNVDLFDEAGLDYPPQEYGVPYADGDPWDVAKLEELALFLTVDENGFDAGADEFDSDSIIQFGFAAQWYNDDIRSLFTNPFGAGSLYDAETGEAVFPENWRVALDFFYRGMWEDYFFPNTPYQQSDRFGNGNLFNSGNVAMATTHLWYTCCLSEVGNFDIAVMPSYNGEVTAKLHADTFRILDDTEHPEEAFQVLTALLTDAAPELLGVYGGLPAIPEQRDEFLAGLEEQFPDVNWQVAIDSLAFPDSPSHESNMPNFNEADAKVVEFTTMLQTTPDLDLDAEVARFLEELQAIFDEAE